MEEKYGFIYVWRDRKHNRYYIGSHWGTEDDGYICSSNNMRNNYNNRPHDFTRRIVARGFTNRQALLHEEQRWLDMIKPEEFGKKYYNTNAKACRPNKQTRHQLKRTVRRETTLFPSELNIICEAAAASMLTPADFMRRAALLQAYTIIQDQQEGTSA
jgi:hypothetical protein